MHVESPEAVKVRMMADRILIRRKEAEKTTPGGLVLPDTAKRKLDEGVIVSVGPVSNKDVYEDAPVEVGDHVLFMPLGGIEIQLDGKDFVVVSLGDIFLVVEE